MSGTGKVVDTAFKVATENSQGRLSNWWLGQNVVRLERACQQWPENVLARRGRETGMALL